MKPLRILALQPHYPANAARFLVDGFERLGCEVVRCGPLYADHYGLQWPPEDLPLVDFPLPRQAPLWHLPDLVDLCTRERGAPDLLWCSEESYQNSVVPTAQVPVIVYSADSWPENYQRSEVWGATLYYCSQPRGNRIHPRTDTPAPWRFLWGGVAVPWLHRPLNVERDLDFVLHATPYGPRPALCDYLKQAGFRLASGPVTTQPYVTNYARAKVTLSNVGWWEVKLRWAEAAAMGCVNIAADIPLLAELGYRAWESFIPIAPDKLIDEEWPTAEELARLVSLAQQQPSLCAVLAAAAKRVTFHRHTVFQRLARIFIDLGLPDWATAARAALEQVWREHGL